MALADRLRVQVKTMGAEVADLKEQLCEAREESNELRSVSEAEERAFKEQMVLQISPSWCARPRYVKTTIMVTTVLMLLLLSKYVACINTPTCRMHTPGDAVVVLCICCLCDV